MSASSFLNRAKMSVSGTPGTGSVTLNAAVSGFATFAEAGAADATKYTYVIEDGNDFEIGQGTYTSSGTLFSRDTVYLSKISGVSGTTKLTLTGSATVAITVGKEDLAGYQPIGVCQPIPSAGGTSLAIGTMALCFCFSSVANNATTAGSNLRLAAFDQHGEDQSTGALTGTWKNISGLTLASFSGYFVRTA